MTVSWAILRRPCCRRSIPWESVGHTGFSLRTDGKIGHLWTWIDPEVASFFAGYTFPQL
jgi:hypothetical protein